MKILVCCSKCGVRLELPAHAFGVIHLGNGIFVCASHYVDKEAIAADLAKVNK
jgi:hypothetical protein